VKDKMGDDNLLPTKELVFAQTTPAADLITYSVYTFIDYSEPTQHTAFCT